MQGNSPRNDLRFPGVINWDFSVAKDTKLGFLGEQGAMEFRAEFFNVLNHVNFLTPPTAPFAGIPSTGTIAGSSSVLATIYAPGTTAATTSSTTTMPITNGGFIQAPNGASVTNPLGTGTQITQARTSRQIQLALKVIF